MMNNRSDSEIASKMKSIYIKCCNPIDPEDLDHFSLDWNDFYDILFVNDSSPKEGRTD